MFGTDWLKAALISVFLVLLIAAGISLNPIKLYRDFTESTKFTEAEICTSPSGACSSDASFERLSLPFFVAGKAGEGAHSVKVRVKLDPSIRRESNPTLGIFLPKYSDSVEIKVGGTTLTPFDYSQGHAPGNRVHYANWPFYTSFLPAILGAKDSWLEIELTAEKYTPLSLFPFYVGNTLELRIKYHIRYFIRVILPQIGLVLLLAMGLLVFRLWLFRRGNREYLWMSLAALFMFIPALDYITPASLLPDDLWVRLALFSSGAAIFACLHYILCTFDIALPRFLICVRIFQMLAGAMLFLVPTAHLLPTMLVYQAGNGLIALGITTICFRYAAPENLGRMHGLLFAVVLAMFLLNALYAVFGPVVTLFQPAYLASIILVLGATALIIKRFAHSLSNLENLNAEMEETIKIKSAEIAKFEKQKAIQAERRRLTLDLHDGVGGQITGTLAYLEKSSGADTFVTDSLESALRDLALIIDSLEEVEDITYLLGTLRSRIEPLLKQSGMELVWQVDKNPWPPTFGPPQALNLIRIVQEAVINAIKHSGAKRVLIRTGDHHIDIIDDGQGFGHQAKAPKHGINRGIGIKGIEARSQALSAQCIIDSSSQGTHISLIWPEEILNKNID